MAVAGIVVAVECLSGCRCLLFVVCGSFHCTALHGIAQKLTYPGTQSCVVNKRTQKAKPTGHKNGHQREEQMFQSVKKKYLNPTLMKNFLHNPRAADAAAGVVGGGISGV